MANSEPTPVVAESGKTMQITLVRSPIGYTKRQKETVKALGLHRMHETIDRPDTPEMRAMVHSIGHMVRIEE